MAKGSGGRGSNGVGKGGRPTRRIVSPLKGGGYRIDAPGAQRASGTTPTKRAAEQRAKEIVRRVGGGEVTFRGKDGRIVDSDTVAPGHDPYPPKDTKH
jgi:hypothetical protein